MAEALYPPETAFTPIQPLCPEKSLMRELLPRPAVLLLGPCGTHREWTVVEVDAEVFEDIHVAPGEDAETATCNFPTAPAALNAAYDLLTLITEGRMPTTHEHVQESVREFVRTLENRGYDRDAAVKLLLQMVDTMSARSPIQTKARSKADRAS